MPAIYEMQDYVEDAFKKLQETIYFDNNDLYLRSQLIKFLNRTPEIRLKKIEEAIINSNQKFFDRLLANVRVRIYPKKIEACMPSKDKIPENFITNLIIKNDCQVNRLAVFCDMPIELHIISVLWLARIGYKLDIKLSKNILGNRLFLEKSKVKFGRKLFKGYVKQYQKWWSGAINAAKNILDNDENVTIINFDLKDYYHRVEFDFSELEKVVKIDNASDKFIHDIFKKIHFYYKEKISNLSFPGITKNENLFPLPIGLISSSILANWHLRIFDTLIEKELLPTYYGRYVDDIIIVLKDRMIDEFTDRQKENLLKYFQRNNIEEASDSYNLNFLNLFLQKYFSKILKPTKVSKNEPLHYRLRIPELDNLELQNDKIYIYQFDHELSPALITKFEEEQKERTSEFRFLSDEEDETFDEFEDFAFEENFDTDDVNKAKFKRVEENRFRISVYLAKIIQRKIERGSDYKRDEIEKVEKYFRGVYALKHFQFWEKIFTLYIVSNSKRKFLDFLTQVRSIIENLKINSSLEINIELITEKLYDHLNFSMQMALGLNPNFLTRQEKEDNDLDDLDEMFFREKGFLRKQFISFPLVQLTDKIKNTRIALINYRTIWDLDWDEEEFDMNLILSFSPYKIKFYEAVVFQYYKVLKTKVPYIDINLKRWLTDVFNSEFILNDAFERFYELNDIRGSKELIKKEYFNLSKFKNEQLDDKHSHYYKSSEYYFKNSGAVKNKCRVGLVNKYISSSDYEASLNGSPVINDERVETYYWILDQVNQVKDLDIFILPELALPHQFIFKYAQFSARNSRGLITGVEHIKIENVGFNFVLTCLPITIQGDRDTVPILRLKNHYAPEEEEWIRGKRMVVPKPSPFRYDLFEWRGFYFSTYYCFELANIYHRTAFYSMIDFLCAPVWNADTHYYSNIVESATRDLHSYIIQVNTSQYGDTRVTRPTDHVRKDKTNVKGGTVEDYKVTLLITDIEIYKLRDFQVHDYTAQKKMNEHKKSFKPTPPGFNRANALKRKKMKDLDHD